MSNLDLVEIRGQSMKVEPAPRGGGPNRPTIDEHARSFDRFFVYVRDRQRDRAVSFCGKEDRIEP